MRFRPQLRKNIKLVRVMKWMDVDLQLATHDCTWPFRIDGPASIQELECYLWAVDENEFLPQDIQVAYIACDRE